MGNLAIQIIFYLFAVTAVIGAAVVITTKNPVKGVLFLVLTFVAMAGIWLLLQAEFLALILVLVYVGAVMTLFLFIVMMLNIAAIEEQRSLVRYLPFGALVVICILVMMISMLGNHYFGFANYPLPLDQPATYSNVQALGALLFTNYLYPFEIAGVILLVAMIAAITLTHRGSNRKNQNAQQQLSVTAQQRLKLVKMPSVVKKLSDDHDPTV